jgi:hypothetical protein
VKLDVTANRLAVVPQYRALEVRSGSLVPYTGEQDFIGFAVTPYNTGSEIQRALPQVRERLLRRDGHFRIG